MELEEKINLNELLKNPIMFNWNSIDKLDKHLACVSDEDDEVAETQTSPWLQSFDKLKEQMAKLPNAAIFKRIMVDGSGDVMGRRKMRIQWSYSLFAEKEESSFDSSFMSSTNIKTNVWDEMLPGLWFALETMRKGEEAQFIIDYKLMFGEFGHDVSGTYTLKPKTDVLLVAKLIDFKEIGSADACDSLTDDQLHRFAALKGKALQMLQSAKDLQNKKLYSQAITVALKTMDHVRFCAVENDEEKNVKDNLVVDIHVLLIDCYVKCEKYKMAYGMLNELREIINIENNVKLMVNEAIIHSKIGDDFARSIGILRKAQTLHPNSELVNRTLADIEMAQKKYKDDTAAFMQKAFQTRSNKQPTPKPINDKLAEIIKSYNEIDIKSGFELIGYSTGELKEIEQALYAQGEYELQIARNITGDFNYMIKKKFK